MRWPCDVGGTRLSVPPIVPRMQADFSGGICCRTDQKSKGKSINFSDCGSIGIFWRERLRR
jgi:hypothetical protein